MLTGADWKTRAKEDSSGISHPRRGTIIYVLHISRSQYPIIQLSWVSCQYSIHSSSMEAYWVLNTEYSTASCHLFLQRLFDTLLKAYASLPLCKQVSHHGLTVFSGTEIHTEVLSRALLTSRSPPRGWHYHLSHSRSVSSQRNELPSCCCRKESLAWW